MFVTLTIGVLLLPQLNLQIYKQAQRKKEAKLKAYYTNYYI